MKILYSRGVGARGKSLSLSWEDFEDFIKQTSTPKKNETEDQKKGLTWFSVGDYKNNHRSRENLKGSVEAIVADLDAVHDPEAVKKALNGYEYLAWTTWSSTPKKPRWRVVLPLSREISKEEYPNLARKILGKIGKAAKIDPRSYTPEQLWFAAEHKSSADGFHKIWRNHGTLIRPTFHVDFTNVPLPHKTEEIGVGSRNTTLIARLRQHDALQCTKEGELLKIALIWNSKLEVPMPQHEVEDTVRKTWRWFQKDGIHRRSAAQRKQKIIDIEDEIEVPTDVGLGLMSQAVMSAKMPDSLIGDFLYPGATMISAKMKEGKSFLAMQLALSAATGTPFLKGKKHPGFAVRRQKKALIIAGEDTEGGIAHRFHGNIAIGNLPAPEGEDDVRLLFAKHLRIIREDVDRQCEELELGPKPGTWIFEQLVDYWYNEGYRIIAVDPLRVMEGILGINTYPNMAKDTNAHSKDFLSMFYYTTLAQKYNDLCIIISMHHGKNKRDHDANDPGDMIAGTSGFGAGVVTTISLLPTHNVLQAEENKEGKAPRRRELYVHGRYTHEMRYLIEQNLRTGIWEVVGQVNMELMSKEQHRYLNAMIRIGAKDKWVTAEAIAKSAGGRTSPEAVMKLLAKVRRSNEYLGGFRLLIKKGEGGGYRLVSPD